MPSSSRWKLLTCCGINFESLGLRSLHIKIKVYHCSFHPDMVRVWKLIFRAMNGLRFGTLSWNLYSTKVWCWVQAVVSLCPLWCPFLGGGKQPFCRGDLPSAGGHQTLSLLFLHIQTICHCHLRSCRYRAVLGMTLPQLLMLGSVWYIQLHSEMHLPVWSLLLAEPASGGLLCYALDLCQAIQLVVLRCCLLSSLSSTWLLWMWAVIKYRAVSILCVPLWVSCW